MTGNGDAPVTTPGPALPGRLVPARRHAVGAVRHRDAEGHTAPRPRRRALPGRLRLRLRARLQAGAHGPGHPDRATRVAARAGPTASGTRSTSTAPRPTTRTRSCRPSGPRACRWTSWSRTPTSRPSTPGTAGRWTRPSSPIPRAFFDWSASQGLHNTLNVHPSILASDPQFAAGAGHGEGQAAEGRLRPGRRGRGRLLHVRLRRPGPAEGVHGSAPDHGSAGQRLLVAGLVLRRSRSRRCRA